LIVVLVGLLAGGVSAGSKMWCGHLTSYGDWATTIKAFNSGDQDALVEITYYDESGAPSGTYQMIVDAHSWFSTTPDQEGSFAVESADNLLVMVSYRYGSTYSVCEFFLKESETTVWVLPNTVRPWMDYTGLALVNPTDSEIIVNLLAIKDTVTVGNSGSITLGPHEKLAAVSDQIWAGIEYDAVDTIAIYTSTPIPPPISITGNYAQDRHLFFTASPMSGGAEKVAGAAGTDLYLADHEFWCSHVTASGDWRTRVDMLYRSGTIDPTIDLRRYSESGSSLGAPIGLTIGDGSYRWGSVPEADLEYEGTADLACGNNLLVKLSYQYGVTPSVCEFFITSALDTAWVLPNSAKSWMDYTGVAVVNPTAGSIEIGLEAWWYGDRVGTRATVDLPPHAKYVRLSDGIWAGLGIDEFDTILIDASAPIPAPISITGNNEQDRHLFFPAQPEPLNTSGTLVGPDDIVGALRYINAWEFYQGSPTAEACRLDGEARFEHMQTLNFAAMETEVTRAMWTALRAAQPTLPADPSTNFGLIGVIDAPVQRVTWREAVLFANLLSVANGLQRCYYKDNFFLIPVDASNYTTGTIYCWFSRTGYRLPTEGEWEYMCRAGTATPFSVTVPAYSATTCQDNNPGVLPQLEGVAWFAANSLDKTHSAAMKSPNPWHLYDIHGNVSEWCWDRYGDYPSGSVENYRGAVSGSDRVIRGGGWGNPARFLRSAARSYSGETDTYTTVGFRLVRTMP
jgi:formylglycine-generating enzyme required for sulfatase activity